jgi:hypothetical protein
MEDAKKQTKIAAKIKRIQKKGLHQVVKGRPKKEAWRPKKKESKLIWNWRLPDGSEDGQENP